MGALLIAAGLVAVALVVERMVPPLNGAVRVVDGDSLELDGERIRLDGIDAPELHQTCGPPQAMWECGRQAREALRRATQAGVVSCRPLDRDRYGRTVAVCRAGEADLGGAVVRAGLALATSLAYTAEEAAARAAHRGLWSGPFESPVEWRRQHRREEG
ncbi:thermonuclease family protein [Ancylobacter lacus]|uniref:thermonuclease family protein n=1 Tax=Ancylobacter lacus TaxID=2579970 RepID=UPI001BCD9918|nr:thermonuclease family protein [Ancylobacter lacus]MBS7541285.1 thermonuclease family protein [Ancylobacter lacus]